MQTTNRLIASLSVLFLGFGSLYASAQRPALTKDVDAKGRIPYMQSYAAIQDQACKVNTDSCLVLLEPVPAGYRLVVEQVSTAYTVLTGITVFTSSPASIVYFRTGTQSIPLPPPTLRVNSIGVQDNSLFVPATFYVEAGYQPGVSIVASAGSNISPLNLHILDHYLSVTVVGYLIALN